MLIPGSQTAVGAGRVWPGGVNAGPQEGQGEEKLTRGVGGCSEKGGVRSEALWPPLFAREADLEISGALWRQTGDL